MTSILQTLVKSLRRSTARSDASTAQLLRDAGISIEPGIFGQTVKSIETSPAVQSQTVSAQSALEMLAYPEPRDGHGVYGQWKLDPDKLPAYLYELNNRRDRLAYFANSQNLDRRDHWHQIGNDHVTGLAGNDGVVQVYLADRGGIFLNRYVPEADTPTDLRGYFDVFVGRILRFLGSLRERYYRWRLGDKIVPRGVTPTGGLVKPAAQAQSVQQLKEEENEYAYAGGYSYLNDGKETWATAHRYTPSNAKTRRVFGIGYFETETVHRDIRHTRRVYAPYGDHPVMLTDIEIQNTGSSAVDLQCYEYWDVNIHQMRVQWIRSGIFATHGDVERRLINTRFKPQIQSDPAGQKLLFRQQRSNAYTMSPEELAGFIDHNPPEVFLANLSGSNLPAVRFYSDKQRFFGNGGPSKPEAVTLNHESHSDNPEAKASMPYCLVMRHDLHLEPGETKKLRFAYGARLNPDQSLDFLNEYSRDVKELEETVQSWKKQLIYFSNGTSSVMPWEMSWHAYNLLSATLYSQFYETHYIPQGSAYLYLHGADGAPRDQALFALPLVYIRPALAREILILLMRMRDSQTLALPYSFVGNGAQDNALGLHAKPSDLDLFFLLALGEYLSATGDQKFLYEEYPLYRSGRPPSQGPRLTVLQHIQAAFKHLEETIKLGPHQLIGIGSGDWDDAIVATRSFRPTFDRDKTMEEGESVPNSQMALYVLPLVASLIEPHNIVLAAKMQAYASSLKTAVRGQWNAEKKWFYRAWVWDRLRKNDPIGNNSLSLQSQVWPLISGLAKEMGIEEELINTIKTQLDDDNPTGAMLEPTGQVWPAVSQLLTWGYQHSRPDLAWRSLNRHTFAIHANVFPSVWFNIWTGPDGTNSHKMPNPGGTWASPVTPMTDLPGMNANQDAMALLGLLRVCGIEPSRVGRGLEIHPKAPVDRYILKTELLDLDVAPGRIAGTYHAANEGSITLSVTVPPHAADVKASVNSVPLEAQRTQVISIPLKFTKGEAILFEVTWH